jgi:hypothetical protein
MIYAIEMASGGMIYIKFHEDCYRRSSNGIRFCLRNLRGWNVGITDGRDL